MSEEDRTMRHVMFVLTLAGLFVIATSPVLADERADWGIAVSVGAEAGSATMLLENATGYHLVAVDPYATIVAAGLGTATFNDIRAGDRIDYAVATWAGANVAEMLMVTPRRHSEVAR
jgi:hypothetical protein